MKSRIIALGKGRWFYAGFSGLFKISETVSRKPKILSWSHYCELLKEITLKHARFMKLNLL